MSKIKFAIVGQGHIGKRHAEMVRRNDEAELIAVCDVLKKEDVGLSEIKENYYTSINEMLVSHPEVEVVTICTPNGLHTEHSIMALDEGKNVVCEKPMALTKKDCNSILSKASEVNKTVFCVILKKSPRM